MRATPELSLHKTVVSLLTRFAYADVVWFHVPNGGRMTPRTGARLKAMGVKAGVSDLVVFSPKPLFLELKAPNGTPTESQVGFRYAVEQLGHRYEIARTPEEAGAILLDVGAITSNPYAPVAASKIRRAA